MDNNTFATDIPSILDYGIEKWQKDFFWPVSHQEYAALESRVENIFKEHIRKYQGEQISSLLLVNYLLFLEYSNLLHALKVIQQLNKLGKKPLYSDSSLYYKGLIENGCPLRDFFPIADIPSKSQFRYQLSIIKQLALSMKYNRGRFGIRKKGMPVVALQPLTPLSKEYVRKSAEWASLTRSHEWFRGTDSPQPSSDLSGDIEEMLDRLLPELRKVAEKESIEISDEHINFLKSISKARLQKAAQDFARVKSKVERRSPFSLLTPTGGKYFNRLLSLAVRQQGGEVTGFVHGSETFRWIQDLYPWLELSTIDRFMVYSEHSIELVKKLCAIYPPLQEKEVEIEVQETNFFSKIWQEKQRSNLPPRIKSVMLIGYPYTSEVRRKHLLLDIAYLDVEMRIVRILKKAGYKVLYKKHPEAQLPSKIIDFFASQGEVVSEPFEEVMDVADTYLFHDTSTTTFAPAVCSNRPIIYIQGPWENWFPEVYELIRKRCRIIVGEFDQRNRLLFDEQKVLDALAKPPEEPDREFAERYLFPQT